MEIIPRIPVPGENPNRRFVGLVDDYTGHLFISIEPFDEKILALYESHGWWLKDWWDLERMWFEPSQSTEIDKLVEHKNLFKNNPDEMYRRMRLLAEEVRKESVMVSPEQLPRAVSILEFDAQIRARGEIPIYDEGGTIVASYPADPKS